MAVYLARSECRNGFWHVVTYEISSSPWVELMSVPTPQPCRGDEPPIVIGKPVALEPPQSEQEAGECEAASLESFTTEWTTTVSYHSGGADIECPQPNPYWLAQGIKEAKEQFAEIAEEYCLLHECKGGKLCLHAGGKPKISFKGVVPKTVGDEKECFLKFEMSGPLGCTCKPKPKQKKPAKKKTSKKKSAARKPRRKRRA